MLLIETCLHPRSRRTSSTRDTTEHLSCEYPAPNFSQSRPLSALSITGPAVCILTWPRQYSYDASMTLDGSSAPWNRVISNLDKVFAMRLYPKEGIQRTTTDGVYFINRERNGQEASGIAYYSRFGNNDGQQPDTYVEVSNGSFAWWENGGEGTLL